jgi:hypothetical protein
MKVLIGFMPLLLLAGCALASGHPPRCGDHGELLKTTKQMTRTITLRSRPAKASYYLLSDHYVVFMDPAELVSFLGLKVAGEGIRADKQLLQLVERDIPLQNDIDLMSYSFENPGLFDLPNGVAADMLGNGTASVIDLSKNDRIALPTITAMTLEGMGRWRDFCEPQGESILFITDVITN